MLLRWGYSIPKNLVVHTRYKSGLIFNNLDFNRALSTSIPNNNNGFYINQVLDNYTDKELKKLSLRQLIFFGKNLNEEKLLTSANYVRTELPVRIAHRIKDFQKLPFKVGINPHIQSAYQLYWNAFQKLKKVPMITNLEQNSIFCEDLNILLNEHLIVISKLALGMAECAPYLPPDRINDFMHKAIMSRIARRVVAEQHIALTEQFKEGNKMDMDDKVGIVSINLNPADTVKKCHKLALENIQKSFTRANPGKILPSQVIPKLILDSDPNVHFPFVQDHIEYVIFEILKNAYKATISHTLETQDGIYTPSPIHVTIAEGSEEVAIRISDQGGGIPLKQFNSLFSFARNDQGRRNALGEFPKLSAKMILEETLPTPAEAKLIDDDGLASQFMKICQSQLGMGLPVSRIAMQYWGGGLNINTLPGLGTDVYLRLPNSKIGAKEHLAFDPPMFYENSQPKVLASAASK